MTKYIKVGAAGLLLGVGIGLLAVGIKRFADEGRLPIISPLGKRGGGVLELGNSDYEVVGFLPPWLISKAKLSSNELDQLIFLGIEVEANGDLVWDSQAKKINDKDYVAMKAQMKKWGKKNVVGIKLFEDKKIAKLLANPDYQKNLIEQVRAMVIAGGFDGVNVDFEYMGDPLAVLNKGFVKFLKDLREAGVGEVGVDVFANTIIKGDKVGIGEMMAVADWVIVMAYDFHRPGMDYTGPVAPIGSPPGERNIGEVVTKVVDLELERKKIILAYPLYGYEWKTYSEDLGALVVRGWYATASYGRVKELLANYELRIKDNLTENWDEESKTPWISYKVEVPVTKTQIIKGKRTKVTVTEDEIHQIYFDNLKSLGIKFQLVVDNRLGGVGFWALGYEGEGNEVWRELERVIGN